ncbi:MAG TPA: histidine triad nucleotide-binding protein [Candidatus Cybelea sp.]|jgi:histidine triad (HIT) family protein|nr:histidine triad nucleotide-binding protein [Candidatus Cybelea sp.]
MNDCIFCKISAGELPAKIVDRSAHAIAIEDLNPQAPTHLLVIPVEHYATLGDATATDARLVAEVMSLASRLGARHGSEGGFRLVVNTGADGGQTVGHLHVHVLAGRRMTWPPG